MKKLIAFIAAVMLVSACALSAGAVELDKLAGAELNEVTWLASEFGSLRAFDLDPSGEYAYCGQINSTGILTKVNLKTSEEVWTYEATNGWAPKSVACDDRGYVYVGLTDPAGPNSHSYIAILKAGDGEEILAPTEYNFGNTAAGDPLTCSFNGGFVGKVGEKYYFWNSVNYDAARMVCFDVTDTKNIKLNENFGDAGVVKMNKLCGIDAQHVTYGVEYGIFDPSDSTIWVAINLDGTKGSAIAHISADGKTLLGTVTGISEAYSCAIAGDYVLVSSYAGMNSCVTVVNKATGAIVGTDYLKSDEADNYTGIRYANGEIYLISQGNQTIYTTAEYSAPIETDAPETPAPAPSTDAPSTTKPDASTTTPSTTKPSTTTSVSDTAKPADSGNNNTGLIIGIAAAAVVIVVVVVIVIVSKKKKK